MVAHLQKKTRVRFPVVAVILQDYVLKAENCSFKREPLYDLYISSRQIPSA